MWPGLCIPLLVSTCTGSDSAWEGIQQSRVDLHLSTYYKIFKSHCELIQEPEAPVVHSKLDALADFARALCILSATLLHATGSFLFYETAREMAERRLVRKFACCF